VILNLEYLNQNKTAVILAWKSVFDVLVIEIGDNAKVVPEVFNELSDFMNKNIADKKIIFISNDAGNISQIYEVRRAFEGYLQQRFDGCKLKDIVPDARKKLLKRKVYFQGVEIELNKILKTDDVNVLNKLDNDSLSLLLENEEVSIGIPTVDTVKYYIDRTLQVRKHDTTTTSTQSEMQPESRGDSVQEVQYSCPHFEENFGSETVTCWKPATLLEGDGQILLLTDEPGMGKSTLLTHLEKKTQTPHPNIWIVRVNINKYAGILDELRDNGCNEKGAFKLLTEAAKIQETNGVLLERVLFEYTYNKTGNMALLIDGVDDVNPNYTKQVIEVLKILSKTQINKIWVTSRNSVKHRLKKELNCNSYSLEFFNHQDQKQFLVRFWEETCPGIQYDCLDNMAKQVVKLSTEKLTVQDKSFMRIPLQSWLLAKMFEENLKDYSTLKTKGLHICDITLCDRYVEKKWDIYLDEKLCFDKTTVEARKKVAELRKTFMYKHMAAALVKILSPQQLEKLGETEMEKTAGSLLNEITEGNEKTGIIIEDMKEGPVFQYATLAVYLAAKWFYDNITKYEVLMAHIPTSELLAVRSMVEKMKDRNSTRQ
jgi:energy-coupling factor transporter ATP-binding protein EcfA2